MNEKGLIEPEGDAPETPLRRFVIMHERSAGNAEVGSMWTETAVFLETATLADVAAWVGQKLNARCLGGDGRVMIQIAQRPTEDAP